MAERRLNTIDSIEDAIESGIPMKVSASEPILADIKQSKSGPMYKLWKLFFKNNLELFTFGPVLRVGSARRVRHTVGGRRRAYALRMPSSENQAQSLGRFFLMDCPNFR